MADSAGAVIMYTAQDIMRLGPAEKFHFTIYTQDSEAWRDCITDNNIRAMLK